jgi:peptidyl-prolyl cis-trans isomerase C
MKKWLKEPLLHFLLIGALLFGLYSLLNPQEADVAENRIVVSSGDIARLNANLTKKLQRTPVASELQELVDAYIREEVYYREAMALGLDQDDTVLRRRMMQKMEFLTNDLADLANPDEAALKKYLLDNKEQYELPARISFNHIYFSYGKRGEQIFTDAATTLNEIQSSADPATLSFDAGDPFMHKSVLTLESPFEVARLFGQEFAGQLFQLEAEGWQGPLESGYGLHLVKVSEKVDARMPELAAVIDKVRTDWTFEQRQKANSEIYRRFKQRYEIVVENMPALPESKVSAVPAGKSS